MEEQEPKNAGSILAPDGFQVGVFVTVLRNHNKLPSVSPDGVTMIDDGFLLGMPIKILAIDLPFLAIEVYDPVYKTFARSQLDIRTRDSRH